jgi:hypothetical protein
LLIQWKGALIEKKEVAQIVTKFSDLYGNRRFTLSKLVNFIFKIDFNNYFFLCLHLPNYSLFRYYNLKLAPRHATCLAYLNVFGHPNNSTHYGDPYGEDFSTLLLPPKNLLRKINIKPHNIQSNKMHCMVFRYSILRYLVNQSNLFRSLMGSSSGIHIKVTFHKTELAMY